MFYRRRRARHTRIFNSAIAGILDTPPLVLEDAPWAIVSMVAKRDVAMYLVAIKSFYPKIGRGKVVAIIDRAMAQPLRDTLAKHLVGTEFVILEDIPTDPCQRGGTWERLLYCLDRSAVEYTIQIDADTLVVDDDLQEVVDCIHANRAFTLADGFVRHTLPETVELARATPSNYIGIVSESALDRYSGYETQHYIRGSSGFVGFAKGGCSRAEISKLHQEMEQIVGAVRWREWGTEQFGSNFAIANSPNPLVLPYPEYASFNLRVPPHRTKFFHFIGAFRFVDGYYAKRCQEVIAALTPGTASGTQTPVKVRDLTSVDDTLPLLFARSLVAADIGKYLLWHLSGRRYDITVRMRARREFQDSPSPGATFMLRAKGAGNRDAGVAYEIFILKLLMPPVWVPPERVKLIVDLGANVGMSFLWWLTNYWRAEVLAFEPHPGHAVAARANIALNGFGSRIDLHQAAVGPSVDTAILSDEGACSSLLSDKAGGFEVEVVDLFAALAGRRVDILKIDIEGSEVGLLDDPRFGALDVGAVVMEWHLPDASGRGGRDWCIARLDAAGYRTFIASENGSFGIVWGYRDYGERRPA